MTKIIMEKKKLGNEGEDMAVNFLKNNGYKIKATNWFYKHKEIDIIAEKEETLSIVEVKTRSSDFCETPNELVPRKKQRFLIEAAEAYIQKNDVDLEIRFDL
ncbi:MAG: YraN family protein, partial [Bacteroidota bacterium]